MVQPRATIFFFLKEKESKRTSIRRETPALSRFLPGNGSAFSIWAYYHFLKEKESKRTSIRRETPALSRFLPGNESVFLIWKWH